jgi:alpha-2-macroglobulin
MKTPALLSKAIQIVSRFAAICSRIPRQIFGNVSWQAPRWLTRTGDAWIRLERAYPRLIAPAIIAIFFVACGAAWTWNWYSHLPKPRFVSVKVQPIPVTELKKDLQFPKLLVYFNESAARLEDLHKPNLSGVRLDPSIGGAWHWAAGDVLVFEPTEDWPADRKFRVVFDRKFFPRHVLMERLVYEAQTPPFAIAIKGLEFYQDPTNPIQRQVTATFEMTHAVEPGELERHIQLLMIGRSSVFPASDPLPHCTITYGMHRRVAYLHSSQITLPEQEDFMKIALSEGVRTTQGGAQTNAALEQKVRIPSVTTMFQIDSIDTAVTRDKTGEPEQLLVINTTADINTRDLAKALEFDSCRSARFPNPNKLKTNPPMKMSIKQRKTKSPIRARTLPNRT